MTALDHAALRALAEAATPGPFRRVSFADGTEGVVATIQGTTMELATCCNGLARANADYIAAAHPQAVLALLDEVERLRAAIEQAFREGHATGWDAGMQRASADAQGHWLLSELSEAEAWEHSNAFDALGKEPRA